MDENFYKAAIRHLNDGKYLAEDRRYDNAVCHYGFAAECALKSLIGAFCDNKAIKAKYGHNVKRLYQDLYVYMANQAAASLLDPALGLKLAKTPLPPALFSGHPERRYASDGVFGAVESMACEYEADFLINEMIIQQLNGYILTN